MNRAVFLDRDGVINRPPPKGHYVLRWEDMEFLPGVAEAIRALNQAGFLVIVASNQRCVGRGFLTTAELEHMHRRMCEKLQAAGARIDSVYYCPHLDEDSCECRKPSAGMLLEAARAHQIELAQSWMIGDSHIDVEAGRSAGCKTALLTTRQEDGAGADMIVSSLTEAVERMLAIKIAPAGGSDSR